ncbi:MAG: ABC transporter substrate-binding protein [Proteobacteria bacterium]|nr:ABC transporter substrate-binding protein [Pseudomonadota bacterium]
MRRMRGTILFLALAFLGACFFNSPGEVIAKEKVLVVGDYTTLRTLDPAFVGQGQDIMLCRVIYQSLLRYKFNTAEIEGDLAKSWTISKDGLVYTFKLRDDVYWHKGFGKFTAHDVKYTFDRVLDPKTGAPARSEIVLEVKEVVVIDDYTIEFRLKKPCVPFLHKLVGPRGTAIVNQKAVEKFGKDYMRNPIGTGPFIFESWTREQCVLVANKDFKQREGPPKIDKVIYKLVPDVDAQHMALQKGDIDLIWVLPRDRAILDRLKAAGCKITPVERPAFQNLFMNNKAKPFDDVRVRRAIAHAIDKDTLIKYVLSGMGERMDSPVPQGFVGHTLDGVPFYEYSPKKAKALLAEAGYPNGFEVNFDTFNSPSYLPLATAIAEQLRQVNITANLVVTDQATWWGKLSKGTTNFTLVLPSLQPDADFPMMRHYHSAAFSPGLNVTKYDQIDDLIEKARSELDEKKRLEYYRQIQVKMMEDVPAVPLILMGYPVARRPHIAGIAEKEYIWGCDIYPMHFVKDK